MIGGSVALASFAAILETQTNYLLMMTTITDVSSVNTSETDISTTPTTDTPNHHY
jgi:hypothetical protein